MKKDTTKKPFFARLLENQELDQVSGGALVTNKVPSDSDELTTDLKSPPDSTQKYPSDTDEGGV
jgi:hypothetical protein